MAVTYMRKLEEEPESYDEKFTTLTKGVNTKVREWILGKIESKVSVLDVGCGTGSLAVAIAKKGNNVVAIDKNVQMITYAMNNYPSDEDVKLKYQIGSFTDLPVGEASQDVIVSTFMLSELRPLEQQIFLRNVWKKLKTGGRLLLAAEFVPSGLAKLTFKIKRWRYRKKLKRLSLRLTQVLKWFYNYLGPIGFKIIGEEKWKSGVIRTLELQKLDGENQSEPGYYRPKTKPFTGLKSQLRIYRCLFTGQIDGVAIEPGIYKSGNPDAKSPIIVTANYDYTYIKVMRDLQGTDAWVLCLDSNGINVWCAARGNDFGNPQLLEAVYATDIHKITDKKTLILPQLSAGGVAVPQLPKKSETFPFRIIYGPVWSKDLPQYIEERPARKPDSMKLANFTLSHRARAGLTHITFLFRKIFVYPIILLFILFIGLGTFMDVSSNYRWLAELCLAIAVANILIFLLLPISSFTTCFVKKGFFFGAISGVVLGYISWLLHGSIILVLLSFLFYYWIAFFSTMSFSGYTMASNPREIQHAYPIFSTINIVLLLVSLIPLTISIFFYQI